MNLKKASARNKALWLFLSFLPLTPACKDKAESPSPEISFNSPFAEGFRGGELTVEGSALAPAGLATVSAVPAWATFSGIQPGGTGLQPFTASFNLPVEQENGPVDINIVITDNEGREASTAFTITFVNQGPAPTINLNFTDPSPIPELLPGEETLIPLAIGTNDIIKELRITNSEGTLIRTFSRQEIPTPRNFSWRYQVPQGTPPGNYLLRHVVSDWGGRTAMVEYTVTVKG